MIDDNRFKVLSQEEDWNLRQFAYNLSLQTQLGEELKGKPCNWYKRLVTAIKEDGDYWGKGFWKEMNEIQKKLNFQFSSMVDGLIHSLNLKLKDIVELLKMCEEIVVF